MDLPTNNFILEINEIGDFQIRALINEDKIIHVFKPIKSKETYLFCKKCKDEKKEGEFCKICGDKLITKTRKIKGKSFSLYSKVNLKKKNNSEKKFKKYYDLKKHIYTNGYRDAFDNFNNIVYNLNDKIKLELEDHFDEKLWFFSYYTKDFENIKLMIKEFDLKLFKTNITFISDDLQKFEKLYSYIYNKK